MGSARIDQRLGHVQLWFEVFDAELRELLKAVQGPGQDQERYDKIVGFLKEYSPFLEMTFLESVDGDSEREWKAKVTNLAHVVDDEGTIRQLWLTESGTVLEVTGACAPVLGDPFRLELRITKRDIQPLEENWTIEQMVEVLLRDFNFDFSNFGLTVEEMVRRVRSTRDLLREELQDRGIKSL